MINHKRLGAIAAATALTAAAVTLTISPANAEVTGSPGSGSLAPAKLGGAPGRASAATSTIRGCPRGDVCMYTYSGWTHSRPEHKYYSYGCHRLHSEYGWRRVLNNQIGWAYAAGLESSRCHFGGSGSFGTLWSYMEDPTMATWKGDIGPINAIKLWH